MPIRQECRRKGELILQAREVIDAANDFAWDENYPVAVLNVREAMRQ